MTTLYICLACRRSILARFRNNNIRQWHSKLTFVSLNGTRTTTDGAYGHGLPNEFSLEDTSPRQKSSIESRKNHADYLELLFEEARRSPSATTPPTEPALSPVNQQLWKDVHTFKELVQIKNNKLNEAWNFLVSNFRPNIWTREEVHINPPAQLRAIAGQLRRDLITARQQSQDLANLPTATEILTVYASLGMSSQTAWNLLVFDLLRKLSKNIRAASLRQEIKPGTYQERKILLARMATDLFTAWKFLGHYSCAVTGTLRSIEDLDWSFLPQDLPSDLIKSARLTGWLNDAFLFIFPYLPKQNSKIITSAVLTTFALLTDHSISPMQFESRRNPLIQLVGKLLQLTQTGMPLMDMKKAIQYQVAANVLKDIEIDWLSVLKGVDPIAELYSETKNSNSVPLELNLDTMKKDLFRATNQRDLLRINQLWWESKSHFKTSGNLHEQQEKSESDRPTIFPQDLYGYFLYAYMGLRKPNQASEVWNHMIERSIQPALSTWIAMLGGCKKSENVAALEGVWSKLIASGTQPDILCWTARISGLFECGMTSLGMRALDEMGQIWANAAGQQDGENMNSNGDIDIAVKPTTATINAAISGLLNLRKIDEAHRVLSWGATLGIPPDRTTFNILLYASVRQGRTKTIPLLLLQMQNLGIQADPVTFKALIELLLDKKSGALTPAQQIEQVNNILETMVATGIQPNQKIYSKMIDVLLRSSPNDLTAVNAILKRMAKHNLQPTPPIYTMLVTFHFCRSPPDIPAVHLLIKQIQLSGATTTMDHIFWDRVIEGFALAKDTVSAMNILRQLEELPNKIEIGWQALDFLIQALVANGEWELARKVLRDVRQQRGPEPGLRETGRYGQHKFWETVRNLNLNMRDSG